MVSFSRSTSLGLLLAAGLCVACPAQRIEETPPPAASPASAPSSKDASTKPATSSPSLVVVPPAEPPSGSPAPVDPSLAHLQKPSRALNTSTAGLEFGAGGVVTSVEAQATRAGTSILEAGGNAVDAAVATALALAVTHPSAGNLGGGGFLLVKKKDGIEAIDFREDAPARLTPALFQQMIARGAEDGAAVGVPGTPAGLHLAHARHGRLPWSRVVAPALELAKNGFVVGPRQALVIGWAQKGLTRSRAGRELFFPGGQPPRAGSRLDNTRLAKALERLATSGPAGFYEGDTARDLVKSLGAHGLITEEDLKRYEARIRAPLAFDFLGFRVVTMPPPSGGGVVLTQALRQLEALRVQETPPSSAARVHLLAEVSRRAQAERRLFVADPARTSEALQLEARGRWLDANTWLAGYPFDPHKATPSPILHEFYRAVARELEHTTHLSVIDADGMAVSCTVTLSASFGARVITEETGIVLNNAVASFSTIGANTPEPSRRTISSMAPTFVLADGQGFLVLGSPGGDTIPSTITQLVVALTVDGLSLAEAVRAPRFHQGFVPDEIGTERNQPLPDAVVRDLKKMGHVVRASRASIGDANVAAWLDGMPRALSDKREGGLAAVAKP